MTLTRERPAREPSLRPAERIEIPDSWRPEPPRPSLRERLDASLRAPVAPIRALGLSLGWLALFAVALAVEPAPADPEPVAWSTYETLYSLALLGAVGAMFTGLANRRRWGVLAAVAASGLLVVASVGCIASGHHAFGTWWLVQMGAVGGALGLSLRALREG